MLGWVGVTVTVVGVAVGIAGRVESQHWTQVQHDGMAMDGFRVVASPLALEAQNRGRSQRGCSHAQ